MNDEQPDLSADLPSLKSRVARALRLSQLFDRASRATREGAVAAARLEVVSAASVIFEQHEKPTDLVILARGRARLERLSEHGQRVPLGYRSSGDVLGEACLGRGESYGESAISMEESEIVRVPSSILAEAVAADPAMVGPVLALLLARQRATEERIQSLLFCNVEGRVAEFLVKAMDRWGVPTPQGTLISAPLTHMDIALSVGSTRETVTLTLLGLRRDGLVDVAGRRLIVKDREGLSARFML
jgi:CRP/FNR family transcriptional regulator, cyclic AMP receptor protein